MALKQRQAYRLPVDIQPGEIELVTSHATCAAAASLYFTDRDGAYSAPRSVLVIRLRNVYYIEETRPFQRAGESWSRIFALTADSTLSTVLARMSSMH